MPSRKAILIKKDSPILRSKAKPVPKKMFGTKELDSIIDRMKAAMHREDDGVAIAAPQIGEAYEIFLVNGETLSALAHEKTGIQSSEKLDDLVFINPEITKLSRKKLWVEEGCLSLRWLYGKVSRSEKATVRAYTAKGKPFTMGASGLLAQIFQHETDHLKGVLFTDKAIDVMNIPPEIHAKSYSH